MLLLPVELDISLKASIAFETSTAKTQITRGKQDSSSDSPRNEEHTRRGSSQCSDIEREAVDGQILKTVRLERSSF